MKIITVFTPAFNRAFCIDQLYLSLVGQTNQNFKWLIVDDGSTDNTRELVQSWIDEAKIEIQYIYQDNQGMHGGHNTAYKNIDTELNVCIDSDDYMPLDAIEKILKFWNVNGSSKVAGIIGLDSYQNGSIIGSKIPDSIKNSRLNDLYNKHKLTGDKKLVIRTEVVNEFPPYPIYESEKLVPLGTLYLMIDSKYEFLCLNEVLCIVEYLEDGSSRNIFKQYLKSPLGFGYARIVKMKYSSCLKVKFRAAVQLVSSAIFAKRIKMFFEAPNLLLAFFSIPFGIILSIYIIIKAKR